MVEPTTLLLGATALGFGVLIYEQVADKFDFDHLETVRSFRKRYLKFGFPVIVALVGASVFLKIVYILI